MPPGPSSRAIPPLHCISPCPVHTPQSTLPGQQGLSKGRQQFPLLEILSPQLSAYATPSYPAGLCSNITLSMKPSLNTFSRGQHTHMRPSPSLYFPIAFIPAFLSTAGLLHQHVASMKAGTSPYGLAVSPAPAVCGTWWKLNK